MGKKILLRCLLEVVGKPKEHIEQAISGYIDGLRKDERYELGKYKISEAIKQEEEEYWSIFADLEVGADNLEELTAFCLEYMPSQIEIIYPKEMNINEADLSAFFNDLQSKLHNVDMVAKQTKLENKYLKENNGVLLKNYVSVLLQGRKLTSEQLSHLMGVKQDALEDFLDYLIDEGKIDLNEGKYFLK